MATHELEVLDRVTSLPTRKSGMLDVPRHGYLSFKLAPDGDTIYYLTGAHINARSTAQGLENMHLVTYRISAEAFRDLGQVVLDTGGPPKQVNSIAIGSDGTVYSISEITQSGQTRFDLISFHPVLFGY